MNQKVPYGFVYETVNKLNGMKYIGKLNIHKFPAYKRLSERIR